ncbi:MAG: efflux RND transporter periplasmic adaptor subunit [Bacteroidota bacterium]
MKKLFIYISLAAALLIIVLVAKKCGNKSVLEVSTEMVKKRDIIEIVSANGKIQPEVEVKISSDVSGEIVELPVKEGDIVQKGDMLVKINPDIYQSSLDRMNASLNTTKANYENAKSQLSQVKAQFANAESNYNRQKKLFDQGAISQAEFDNAKSQYESAKANVEGAEQAVKAAEFNIKSSEAALQEAMDNLKKTTITSPVNGRVIKLSKEKGEKTVGTNMMEGTEIMVIASSNEMEVNVEVNENDIIRVHMNDTAIIEVDAYLGRKFKGIVTEIANSANTTGITADQVTNFTVKVRILQDSYKDLDNPFRRGMSATVDIQTKRVSKVLSVPIQAVTTRSDTASDDTEGMQPEGEQYETRVVTENPVQKEEKKEIRECVFLYRDGKAVMVYVKTGIQDVNYIEIKEGLKEGDEVITGPYTAVSKLIRNGSKVERNNSEAGIRIQVGG